MTAEGEGESSGAIEPGWYPDPANPSVTRWWNGMSWGRCKGRVNRLAVAALAFAWAFPIGGPPAVVLGFLAIQEINDFGRTERGKGLAIWAILIGALNIVALVAGSVFLVIALTKTGHHHANGGLGCAAWEEIEGLC